MDSTEKPEVPVASEKSISDQDIIKEFDEFEAQMKYKYGTKASAITMNLFAQEGGKQGERVEFERDYFLIGMSLGPVAYSVTLVNNWLQSNGFESSVILWSSVFLQLLVACCLGIYLYRSRSWKRSETSNKPIVDSSRCDCVIHRVLYRGWKGGSVSPRFFLRSALATCPRCEFYTRDITADFDKFQAKMKGKYGEKTTVATMKFFAQGAQARGELNVKERLYFTKAMILTQLAFSAFILYLSLSKQGYDYPLLAYFSICCHFLALYFHGSNITHDRYSKLFTPSSYSIVIFIISISFAAHFSVFYSWTHVYHSQ